MHETRSDHRALLRRIAHQAMIDRGLEPEFPPQVLAEIAGMHVPPLAADLRDLRERAWSSIDNDDSRDLDQLEVAEVLADGRVRILVAIADVACLVGKGSAVDAHAQANTTSVYTAGEIFPMLPEKLCTNLTSLNAAEDRQAVVVEMQIAANGEVDGADVYPALVRNHAKLAYDGVAAWLDGDGPAPEALESVPGMDDQLRVQDQAAGRLEQRRRETGALEFESAEGLPIFEGDRVRDIEPLHRNRARRLIENFMVAANGVTARFLEARGRSSIRRVVRSPRRWDRIVALARQLGETLPPDPDAGRLQEFLVRRRAADPTRFPDLSLAIIKLLGPGEYVLERAGEDGAGHFDLGVRDYAHSTAPNRRYPDLVTERLIKAALAGDGPPYADAELDQLALRCTRKEDDANKVERLVRKAAAALMLESRRGERFDGVVTGASQKGTWVRVLRPPVEGRLVAGFRGVDVGDRVRVKLVETDPERGFIDFVRV